MTRIKLSIRVPLLSIFRNIQPSIQRYDFNCPALRFRQVGYDDFVLIHFHPSVSMQILCDVPRLAASNDSDGPLRISPHFIFDKQCVGIMVERRCIVVDVV
jgi:hypothetical protein